MKSYLALCFCLHCFKAITFISENNKSKHFLKSGLIVTLTTTLVNWFVPKLEKQVFRVNAAPNICFYLFIFDALVGFSNLSSFA